MSAGSWKDIKFGANKALRFHRGPYAVVEDLRVPDFMPRFFPSYVDEDGCTDWIDMEGEQGYEGYETVQQCVDAMEAKFGRADDWNHAGSGYYPAS